MTHVHSDYTPVLTTCWWPDDMKTDPDRDILPQTLYLLTISQHQGLERQGDDKYWICGAFYLFILDYLIPPELDSATQNI